MRLLHTSDWHLGRSFGPFSLLDLQQRALERIVGLVREHRVDLVVVAGDVFDRAVPPTEAVVLLRDTLAELRGAGAQVAVVAGNHDSAERMAAYEGLLEPGLVIVGGYRRAGLPITLPFADGEVDVVPLPFLDPLLAPPEDREPGDREPGDREPGDREPVRPTHASVLHRRLRAARRQVAGRRSVAIAHAFVAGGTPSPSEREVGVGGSEQVGVRAFDGFSYVALGHLHAPQAMGRDTLSYSGSPLAYSFAETVAKSVTLVDLAVDGAARVERVELGVCRGVATVTGTLDQVLTDATHDAVVDRWVRVQLTDTGALVEPMARVRARFPHAVELHRRSVVVAQRGSLGTVSTPRVHPLAAVADFWRAATGDDPSVAVLGQVHAALVAAGAPPVDVAAFAGLAATPASAASTDSAPAPGAPIEALAEGRPAEGTDTNTTDSTLAPTLFDDAEFVRVDTDRPRSRRLRPAS